MQQATLLPTDEEEDTRLPIITVYGKTWTVCATDDEARETVRGMRLLNRWWRNHKGDEVVRITKTRGYKVTNPLARCWSCSWVPGHAGWTCEPMTTPHREEVRLNNSLGEQVVVVNAPTALLAIERAKFLLMLEGKKNDY